MRTGREEESEVLIVCLLKDVIYHGLELWEERDREMAVSKEDPVSFLSTLTEDTLSLVTLSTTK
jgi:hypothetical protein